MQRRLLAVPLGQKRADLFEPPPAGPSLQQGIAGIREDRLVQAGQAGDALGKAARKFRQSPLRRHAPFDESVHGRNDRVFVSLGSAPAAKTQEEQQPDRKHRDCKPQGAQPDQSSSLSGQGNPPQFHDPALAVRGQVDSDLVASPEGAPGPRDLDLDPTQIRDGLSQRLQGALQFHGLLDRPVEGTGAGEIA